MSVSQRVVLFLAIALGTFAFSAAVQYHYFAGECEVSYLETPEVTAGERTYVVELWLVDGSMVGFTAPGTSARNVVERIRIKGTEDGVLIIGSTDEVTVVPGAKVARIEVRLEGDYPPCPLPPCDFDAELCPAPAEVPYQVEPLR